MWGEAGCADWTEALGASEGPAGSPTAAGPSQQRRSMRVVGTTGGPAHCPISLPPPPRLPPPLPHLGHVLVGVADHVQQRQQLAQGHGEVGGHPAAALEVARLLSLGAAGAATAAAAPPAAAGAAAAVPPAVRLRLCHGVRREGIQGALDLQRGEGGGRGGRKGRGRAAGDPGGAGNAAGSANWPGQLVAGGPRQAVVTSGRGGRPCGRQRRAALVLQPRETGAARGGAALLGRLPACRPGLGSRPGGPPAGRLQSLWLGTARRWLPRAG
jgi:hypothetical protein